ncbi:hypothetical protein ACS0TY_027758 [Phlomoides rotata]
MNIKFVYVLTGWEGSTADSRVLRNAITRPNGLKVPKGNYYLCDNGYPNCEGFLTPYKGVRYHLSEWSSRHPQSHQEYFNMKHTRARNVIERTFGLPKMRWGILSSPSWYPIKTANKITMACYLLHNYIRKEMDVDPLESDLDDYISNSPNIGEADDGTDIVDSLDATPEWTIWRDSLAMNMFNEWRNGHGKKEYGALSDLLSKSGIDWNSTTSMIEVEGEAVWDGCRRADPHVKGLRFKTWPYYPQWIEIFGKDRATGEHVVDPIDLVNELYRNVLEQKGETGEKNVPLNHEVMLDTEEDIICKPTYSNLKTSCKGKKRKNYEPDLNMLVDSLGEFMKTSTVAMGDYGKGPEKEYPSEYETTRLNDIMKGIIGLKVPDKLKVCDELIQNSKRLVLFFSLPPDEQEEYVWMLLRSVVINV